MPNQKKRTNIFEMLITHNLATVIIDKFSKYDVDIININLRNKMFDKNWRLTEANSVVEYYSFIF